MTWGHGFCVANWYTHEDAHSYTKFQIVTSRRFAAHGSCTTGWAQLGAWCSSRGDVSKREVIEWGISWTAAGFTRSEQTELWEVQAGSLHMWSIIITDFHSLILVFSIISTFSIAGHLDYYFLVLLWSAAGWISILKNLRIELYMWKSFIWSFSTFPLSRSMSGNRQDFQFFWLCSIV